MNNTLSNAVTVVLTICAVIVTGLLVKREFAPPAPAAEAEAEPRMVGNWQQILGTVLAKGHVIGPRDAPVKVVEFADFQCPFCARAQPVLERIRRKYPDQVAIVYGHLPLQGIHPYAFTAALASERAGAQGQFAAYHDVLFEHQDSIGEASWTWFAKRANVSNLAEFRRCVKSERLRARVTGDAEIAEQLGLTSTPAFIVNGRLWTGSGFVTSGKLENLVREILRNHEAAA